MNFAASVMLRGLLENACDGWSNPAVDGIVKL